MKLLKSLAIILGGPIALILAVLGILVQLCAFALQAVANVLLEPCHMIRRTKFTDGDRYCLTLPDGSCVSDDPRCMHNRGTR